MEQNNARRDYIMSMISKPLRGKNCKNICEKTPCTIMLIRNSCDKNTKFSVKICITDGGFKELAASERWSYAFLPDEEKLYVFPGITAQSYKTTGQKDYHFIRFINDKLAKTIFPEAFHGDYVGPKNFYFTYDREAKLFYIQLDQEA